MQQFFSLLSWRLFTAQHVSGGKTPETCWAVNKRQDNKLKNLHQVGDLFELYDDARTHKP